MFADQFGLNNILPIAASYRGPQKNETKQNKTKQNKNKKQKQKQKQLWVRHLNHPILQYDSSHDQLPKFRMGFIETTNTEFFLHGNFKQTQF